MVASVCAVPACTSSRARRLSGRADVASQRSRTSTSRPASSSPGRTSVWPRPSSSLPSVTLTAVRLPAVAASTAPPCTCTPRTLPATAWPAVSGGSATTSSPARKRPAHIVPVTTVPKPFIVNTRSIGSRNSPSRIFARHLAQPLADRRLERVEPFAALGAAGDDRRALEERAAQGLGDVGAGQLAHLAVDEVALGERHDAARDAEQAADVEVLARLRHHAFVGGDDEHDQIDADRAGDHRAHEALVAGHVDDADRLARRQRRGARSRARW